MARFTSSLRPVLLLVLVLVGCQRSHEHKPDADTDTATPNVTDTGEAIATPANVLVIIADDLGYADVSMYGGRVPTPNIDRLGAEGIRFTQAYATAPVCGPSRAGMLTGRYQQRFGYEYNNGPQQRDFNEGLGLPSEALTLAELMKPAGYRTGLVGKWHLGSIDAFYPMERGFDSFYGILPGGTLYIDPLVPGVEVAHIEPDDGGLLFDPDVRTELTNVMTGPDRTVIDNTDEYLTDVLTDEAVAFIDAEQDDPFLLVVSYTAPHLPLQVTAEYYDRFPDVTDHALRVYFGMIAALDDGVGEILSALDARGLAEDTLVVFASDNGCSTRAGVCDCDVLSGGKATFLEGGVRVPFAVRWPAGLPSGMTWTEPVSTLDVAPTALAAAQIATPAEFDGVDLAKLAAGASPRNALFWRAHPSLAARVDSWKLLESPDGTQLYDLAIDSLEEHDRSADSAVALAEARAAAEVWEQGLVAPLWEPSQVLELESCGRTFTVSP